MEILINEYLDSDGYAREIMLINGEEKLEVGALTECPEDAIIGRGLVSCHDVASFMQIAYQSAVNGEKFSIASKDCGSTCGL